MFFPGEGIGAVFSYGAPGKERWIPVSGVSGKGGGVRAGARCSEEIFRRPRECACNQHEVMYVAFIQTLDVWMNYLKKE